MKSEAEIIDAHNMLAQVATPGVLTDPAERIAALAALNALCWVLEHEHNPQFERALEEIRGKLFTREELREVIQ